MQTSTAIECPACSGRRIRLAAHGAQIHECRRCGAIFGSCYLGDSYALVLPYFHPTPETVASDTIRYFDFDTLGSAGLSRRHGWFDPQTRKIVQVG